MTKEFLPYDRALKLKQLGFDEPCISHYTAYGKFSNDYSAPKKYNSEFELGSYISAPTLSQAFRWFREIHALDGFFDRIGTTYIYKIRSWKNESTNSFFTYEEAELACLDKLIEIVELKPQDQ
jgi:hypothetical protein